MSCTSTIPPSPFSPFLENCRLCCSVGEFKEQEDAEAPQRSLSDDMLNYGLLCLQMVQPQSSGKILNSHRSFIKRIFRSATTGASKILMDIPFPYHLKKLIELCCSPNPSDRPSAQHAQYILGIKFHLFVFLPKLKRYKIHSEAQQLFTTQSRRI